MQQPRYAILAHHVAERRMIDGAAFAPVANVRRAAARTATTLRVAAPVAPARLPPPIIAAPAAGAPAGLRSARAERLMVHVSGDGPPLILLHGLTSTHREWIGLRSMLARDSTCLAWDARGHGEHPAGESPVTIADLACDLAAVVASLAPRKPVVVGHSIGAVTIFEYLRTHGPEALAGIVIVDQSPRMLTGSDWEIGLYGEFSPADNLAFEWQMRRDAAEDYLRLLACGFNALARAEYDANTMAMRRRRHLLRAVPGAPWLALWKSFAHKDYRDDIAAATVPVLVVLGEASNLYDAPRLARWYTEHVPCAQVLRYDGADHAPHLCLPARFAREVAAFAGRCALPAGYPRARAGTSGLGARVCAGSALSVWP
jgi:pimeloyl-ACP methyl ester carboxylesterase